MGPLAIVFDAPGRDLPACVVNWVRLRAFQTKHAQI